MDKRAPEPVHAQKIVWTDSSATKRHTEKALGSTNTSLKTTNKQAVKFFLYYASVPLTFVTGYIAVSTKF